MSDDVLYISEDDRYSRLQLINWWSQDRLRAGRVMVVGAGALGNEVLKNLALLGVGRIWLIDFDTIENSNLSRSVLFRAEDRGLPKAHIAAKRVHQLNPDVQVAAHHGNVLTDVGLGVFADMDVVIGCLDNREARLWVNRCCWKVGRPWIDGGIQEISGVCKVFDPRVSGTACYECGMTANDYRLINLRYSCPLLRREDLLEGKVPTAPTISSIIAGVQVQEALKLLHGLPVAAGKAIIFNGHANSLYTTAYQYKEDCLSHERYPPATRLELSHQATAAELFRQVRALLGDRVGAEPLVLELDRDLVTHIECAGQARPVFRPRAVVGMREAQCPDGGTGRPRLINQVVEGAELSDLRLAQLGVPPSEVLRIRHGSDSASAGVYLLAEDYPLIWGAGP